MEVKFKIVPDLVVEVDEDADEATVLQALRDFLLNAELELVEEDDTEDDGAVAGGVGAPILDEDENVI